MTDEALNGVPTDDEPTPSLADLAAQVEARKSTIDVSQDPEVVLMQVREELARPPTSSQPGQIGNEVFRNGVLVRIGRDDDDEPILVRHTGNTMTELLAQRVTFIRQTSHGISVVDPPGSVVGKVLDAPDVLDVPVVQQIVNAPVFGPNGELRTEPGLLKEARVWYEPADAMKLAWEVPASPTTEHLSWACWWINELFCDFPLDTTADQAHAWALLLQPMVRPMIDGPTPMYVVEAPAAGTGKGKLATAALIPALGYEIAAHPAPHDHEEWRKHIMASLLKGKPALRFDNVNDQLDSAVLSSALTERVMEDRILGQSKIITVPVRCLWVMTANNPRLSQEIARRSVQIRIDAKMQYPQTRPPDTFKHPELERWARENRGQLVWSALTIIQSWIAAGQPQGSTTMGSYEAWCGVMGGILGMVGLGDAFLANREMFWTEHTDDQSDDACAALELWWAKFGDTAVTAAELARMTVSVAGVDVPSTIGDLLLSPDGDGLTPRGRATALGTRLRSLERRVLCEYRIEPAGTYQNRRRYRLQRGTN